MKFGRLFALAVLTPLLCLGASPDLVISQIYGGGGNSGAPFTRDFVVIFNRGASTVNLDGYSLQYASTTGSFNAAQVTKLSNKNLPAGGYHLVGLAVGGANGSAIPTVDTDGNANLSATAGKVAIVNGIDALACGADAAVCTSAKLAQIVDLVGYGSTANLSETSPAPGASNTTLLVRANGGCTDTDRNALDFATSNATGYPIPSSVNTPAPCSGVGPSLPTISINDVSLDEGNSGTTTFLFTVSLSAPAGPGGVTFNIATQNGTAIAPDDYTARSINGATIPAGGTEYLFAVAANGDTIQELDENFTVVISSVTGATALRLQGTGTIRNDDVTLTGISAVQGSGTVSPLNGQSVTVQGIVTARISNGFFLQDSGDGNPATSDGIFVFTSSTPSANAAVGNSIRVSGTVTEFTPSSDSQSPPVTEIINPSISAPLSTNNPLPPAVTITPAMVTATGGINQLENLEGMLVNIANLRVVGPTAGSVSEATATSTSTGVFYAVMPGVANPLREAGIQTPNVPPTCAAGTACAIPVFDANPERIRVDSDAAGQPALDLGVNQTVSNLTGVLHYAFRTYSVLPTAPATVGGTPIQRTSTPVPAAGSVTVAAMNVERLYDSIDDPGGDVVVQPTAYQNRLGKISKAIREVLRTPDVISLEEVETLLVAQQLASRISADAVAASQPDPGYVAYLVEGNDVGGIDVGFLVKSSIQVQEVTQFGKTTTYTSPCNGAQELLNDRPPLRLRATAVRNGQTISFVVFANHLRSLNDIESTDACGGTTTGARVRAKRAAQANYLAGLIQAELAANPAAKILAVGDFNAFEVNDGLVDVLNTITGTPAPLTQVATASDDPAYADFTNLLNLLPVAQRYSYVFDGNHQTLDHVLLSPAARAVVSGGGYGRVNAEFPDNLRSNPALAERYSDHDPVVVHLTTASDITSQLTVSRGGVTYNRVALTATSSVIVRNNTANTISGPLQVVISGLTTGVTVTNASANQGAAYVFNLPATLAPGQSVTVPLQFAVPSTQSFNYSAAVFAGVL